MACGVLCIIEKLLKRRCLKWAHIAHLDIWNTSYGQKKAGSQIASLTPNQKKSGIDPIYLALDDVRHTFGKLSTRAITLL
jgi:hypothetical protein